MSILKSFVNPWELNTGVLDTNVLSTKVLENNVLDKYGNKFQNPNEDPKPNFHRIKQGDTYIKIIKKYPKYNLTIEKLKIWNGDIPDKNLPIGTDLLIVSPFSLSDDVLDSLWEEQWNTIEPYTEKHPEFGTVRVDEAGFPLFNTYFNAYIDRLDNTGGASTISIYNNVRRSQYIRKVKTTAEAYLKQFDIDPKWDIVEEAYTSRNEGRTAARKPLSPGSRIMSEQLDKTPALKELMEKYHKPGMTREQVGKKIIEKSGSTNSALLKLNRFTKWAGPIGLGLSAYSSFSNIKDREDKIQATFEETSAFIGSAVGFDVGMAVGALGAVAVAGLIGVTAPAWVIIGASITVGAAVGIGMAWIARRSARWVGNWFE